MKIFLTGGNGMVGTNVLEHSKRKEHIFYAPTSKQLNLNSLENIKTSLSIFKPDIIVHAAGRVSGIQANISNPYGFLYDNALIGMNLIQVAKELNIKNFLNLGSSCMYPKNAINPLKEDLVLTGEFEPTNEGYAIAKTMIARLCEYSWRDGFQYKTIIPCNLYGRWDKFDLKTAHMVPAVIHKLHLAKTSGIDSTEIWGDGTARREFMYAGDLAEFIYFAVENYNILPQMMNVGMLEDYSILEYYKTIAEIIGYTGSFEFNTSKPVGMKQKKVDISKQTRLAWTPPTSLREGLAKTYEFFLEKAQ